MHRLTSENRIIQLIRDRYEVKNPLIKKGIGDDAAVIHSALTREFLLITTDMLLEGIDFRCDWTTPRSLGSKSIAVNLSDIAAMGCRPQFFTVSLAVRRDISERWILDLYDGLTRTGGSYGAQLIGGDLSHSDNGIVISITVLGKSLNGKILYRSGGEAGDFLFVTGILGRSAAGLRLLEDGGAKSLTNSKRDALMAHHLPVPRCKAGLWLAQCGMVHCMMDLSDGLSMDLPRMCTASGVGAEIDLAALPVFSESKMWGCDPVELALHGGEDFELLFAVPASKCSLFEKTYPSKFPKVTRIGKLTRDAGDIWIIDSTKKRRRLSKRGYDHFRQRPQHRRKQK